MATAPTTPATATTTTNQSPGQAGYAVAAAGLMNAYASQQAGMAAAINQQTGMLLNARAAIAVSGVRADYAEQYAYVQAGRAQKKAEIEAQNYTIAGNQLLKNMRSTNAAIRARAAANGVAIGSGSTQGVQQQNIEATMRDVAVADFNALAARVYGFEDASAMIESTQIQNIVNNFTAQQGMMSADIAGAAGVASAGLLGNIKLGEAMVTAARTIKT